MFKLSKVTQVIIFHLLLGVIAKGSGKLFCLYYLCVIGLGLLHVIKSRDKGSIALKYAAYLTSLEVVYRMAGASFFYELGKYGVMALCITGYFVSPFKAKRNPFFFILLLLLPAVLFTEYPGTFFLYRKMVLFNLSGGLVLAFTGIYCYQREVEKEDFWQMMRWAVLPAITLVTFLFLGAKVSEIDFTSSSNFEASGGFGPNQVSCALSFCAIPIFLSLWNGKVLTINKLTDCLLMVLILIRALLTFSRGGVIAMVIALLASTIFLYFLYKEYRAKVLKSLPGLIVILILFGVGIVVANNMSNNWLRHRYMNENTMTVKYGVQRDKKSLLTGRDVIMDAELKLFRENFLTGTGVGMSKVMRQRKYGYNAGYLSMASHTEYTRLLSEHGVSGAIIIFLLLVALPFKRFVNDQNILSLQFMLIFFILGALTMWHAAMRTSLAAFVIASSFIVVKGAQSKRKRLRLRRPKKTSRKTTGVEL